MFCKSLFLNVTVRVQFRPKQQARNDSKESSRGACFGIFGPPAIMFFDSAGNEMRELRVIGFQPAERFVPTLERVLRPTAQGSAR